MLNNKRQLLTKQEWICVTLFSNLFKEQMRLKIRENLRTTSLNQKFTDSDDKSVAYS